MIWETDLSLLLKSLNPIVNPGEYVFCHLPQIENLVNIISYFKEQEWITVIVKKNIADELGWEYSFIAAWITLQINSSLEAIGLTAAFSSALAEKGISCNVVAGYYHDHIFVEQSKAQETLQVLINLSQNK